MVDEAATPRKKRRCGENQTRPMTSEAQRPKGTPDEADPLRYRNVGDEAPVGAATVIQPRNNLGRLGLPQVWEYRHLLKVFVMRALRGRYRPTMLGYGWIVLRPALLCLVYAFVFSQLARVDTGHIPYAAFAFLGILVFLFFAGGVTETANALVANAGIMSKVYYPRLIAPLTTVLSNFLDMIAGMVVVVALMVVYLIPPSPFVVLFPLFLLAIAGLTFGLGLILAAYTVERRDIMIALPVVMRVAIYLMPAVYPVTLIPSHLQAIYYLNPIAAFMQGLRWSLWGEVPPPLWSLVFGAVVTAALIYFGLRKFNAVESTMVDRL